MLIGGKIQNVLGKRRIVGSVYLSITFNPYVTIVNIAPGIALLGVGMGIVFPDSANEIFSVARRGQQPDASRIMNTEINLSSSLETAVFGVILIRGSFSGLDLALNNTNIPYQQEQIIGIHSWFESIGIGKPGNMNEKQVLVSSKKIDTMKSTFDIIIVGASDWIAELSFNTASKEETKIYRGMRYIPNINNKYSIK